MAYVTGFRHDVFVSYAHIDNHASMHPNGWVTEFVKRLRAALPIRLGDGESADICFDSGLGNNEQIGRLIDSASNSAIFVAIGSRTYITRDFTMKELAAFAATGAATDQFFIAESLPLLKGIKYPAPIHDHKPLPFHERFSDGGTSFTIMPEDPRFNTLINDLAEQISEKLRTLRGTPRPAVHAHPIIPAQAAASEPGRTVLLAETTDDQEDERQQVRRYLEQFNVQVLPTGIYPQGGKDFEAAFADDLKRAALFVQLLGRSPGRRPPDLPSGYVHRQAELAGKSGIEILQWRSPHLELDSVTDAEHWQLLTRETVRMEGLEAFKRAVKERALAPPPRPKRAVSLAFISTDRKDLEFAKLVHDEFASSDVTVALPRFGETGTANREDLDGNLIDCQALLFIYANATPEWVRGQLRYFAKLKPRREEPPRVIALCMGPPPEKDDIAMAVPGMRHIDCRSLDMSAIRSLVTEMTL